MSPKTPVTKVGDLKPSQMLHSFGIGAIIDLPNLSVMVMGIDDWDTAYCKEIGEERLLAAVRNRLGPQVEKLFLPPRNPNAQNWGLYGTEEEAKIGVPVAPFPRWMRCPKCDLLAPLRSGLFEAKTQPFHPERTRYEHTNCEKSTKAPTVLPARFLVACNKGHLDDFPWIYFVHKGTPCASPILRLRESGVSGQATDISVSCANCGAQRRMSDAFGEEGKSKLPGCRSRRPHLRDFEDEGCEEKLTAILLGASNSWFAINLSTLSIPTASDKLARLVDQKWHLLTKATSKEILAAFRQIGQLPEFIEYSDDAIWEIIDSKKNLVLKDDSKDEVPDLKMPEWEVFSKADASLNTDDFQLTIEAPPFRYEKYFSKTVLVERLREVSALVGFMRIESPGDYIDSDKILKEHQMSISRMPPKWVPACEVRGEGIFLQFKEEAITEWMKLDAIVARGKQFFEAHKHWRSKRHIEPPEKGFPGVRYLLLHTFAHALMRQLALECGYTAASIKERIYSSDPDAKTKMAGAGVLLYTAAPDSEGTLGGLVSLGEPKILSKHIDQALEQMRLCASDPLCSEHNPHEDPVSLHGAACHACLFAPETSCEIGNKYLDRSMLVRTFGDSNFAFF